MSPRVVPIAPARAERLRRDVLRWAAVLDYSPDESISGEPDALLGFLEACAERFPAEFTVAHTREVFQWHREHFRNYVRALAASGNPDAIAALPYADRASARKEGR